MTTKWGLTVGAWFVVLLGCSENSSLEPGTSTSTVGAGGDTTTGSGGTAPSSTGGAGGTTSAGGTTETSSGAETSGSGETSGSTGTTAAAGAAGTGSDLGAIGGGLPGCPASHCDAHLTQTACEADFPCAWQRVVIVPEGDLACAEAIVEQRCLDMPFGGAGGCIGPRIFCDPSDPGNWGAFVRTERGIAITSGCEIHPTCFELCEYADPETSTGLDPAECQCLCEAYPSE